MSQRYPIKYRIEHGDFSEEEIIADRSLGGCDSVFYGSVTYTEDGGSWVNLFSLDGRTKKEMTPKEMFEVWIMLGKILHGRNDLDIMRRDIAGLPFNIMIDKKDD